MGFFDFLFLLYTHVDILYIDHLTSLFFMVAAATAVIIQFLKRNHLFNKALKKILFINSSCHYITFEENNLK